MSWKQGESTWSFTRTDGTWSTTEQPAWPVKQDTLQDLADQLTGLQATRKLENVSSLADYGLETPSLTVTASWADGNETVYSAGAGVPGLPCAHTVPPGHRLRPGGKPLTTLRSLGCALEETP